jgi:hypothetical protein
LSLRGQIVVVDGLLQRGWTLHPVNPKAAQRYRERKGTQRHQDRSPRRLGAWPTPLRTDGRGWRPLLAQDEATATLRALCRDELGLIEQRTALVNQPIAALREYYPAAYSWPPSNPRPRPKAIPCEQLS